MAQRFGAGMKASAALPCGSPTCQVTIRELAIDIRVPWTWVWS